MPIIVPTITTDDPATCAANLADFSKFAKRIHVDVSDGSLAPTQLIPLTDVHPMEGVTLDVHLMSKHPSEHMVDIIKLHPSLCIIHAESADDFATIAQQLHGVDIKVGLALLRSTYPRAVQPLIELADHVMIFAGELGVQGGAADMLQIEKIPLIRAIKSDIEIGWDGGANLTNIRALAHSGADVINVGSAITRADDRPAMYQALLTESDKKGVLI